MPSPVTTAPTGSAPYTGSTTDVPVDRSDVTLNVITGATPPRASSINYTHQFFTNLFQRVWKKAGFLDLASTWTAKQTFGAVDTTGTVNLNAGATVASGQTLTLTGATVTGGTYSGQTLTSPTINGGTVTGTVTSGGATFTALVTSGAVTGASAAISGALSASTIAGQQVVEAKRVVGAGGQPAYAGAWATAGAGTWFYKDNAGRVFIHINATGGQMGTIATPIFSLPSGYRPSVAQHITTPHVDPSSSTTIHYVVVEPTGEVWIRKAVPDSATTGFTFMANGSVLL